MINYGNTTVRLATCVEGDVASTYKGQANTTAISWQLHDFIAVRLSSYDYPSDRRELVSDIN